MGQVLDGIDDAFAEWIAAQRMWFVAPAARCVVTGCGDLARRVPV